MNFSDFFGGDPGPPKITAIKDFATVDIHPPDTDPLPMLEDMERKGWTLVTSYPPGSWRIRFVFRRTA